MNKVLEQRKELETRHYVLKADSSSSYWFGLSNKKIKEYYSKFGEGFNIIIQGNDALVGDYYVIPFSSIKDLLVPTNLYITEERERWVGDIKNHILRLRQSNIERNISDYYTLPVSFDNFAPPLKQDEINDYSIENAKKEISVRLKQSLFRSRTLSNFDFKCCLTGLYEVDLLVASHIIPWSEKIETRLDPSNGLCLSVLYDKLFDKGYFAFDNNLRVIITQNKNNLSSEIQSYLNKIEGMVFSHPKHTEISLEALAFHREKIFK